MDLVEIRKKANSKKKKTAKVPDQSAAESLEPQEQPQPEEAAPVEAPAEESLSDLSGDVTADQTESPENESVSLPGSETDPLDALFSYSVEDGLMVQEANLQSLVGEDDVVDNDIQQWLTFSLVNEEYAVTIDSVSEIIMCFKQLTEEGAPSPDRLLSMLPEQSSERKYVTELLIFGSPVNDDGELQEARQMCDELLLRLQAEKKQKESAALMQLINEAQRAGNQELLLKLLQQKQEMGKNN